jgi:tripartite-type tricarboxylate transporter receptor subunit TctC
MKNVISRMIKTLGIMLVLTTVFAAYTAVYAAAPYPSRPIRLIIPVPPGGSVDIAARLIAAKLSERLGKQVMPENHGGGGGIIGTEIVAKADTDGYTLLFISATHTIQPALQKLPYDPVKVFVPIARVASAASALVVHPSVPANSVKELIALAKQKPGQLIFVCAGSGSSNHMSTELFRVMADIDFKIVQFKGGGPSVVDLLGGHSHATLGSIPQVLPHIKSGKLRALGTGGAKRNIALPDVPTIEAAGLPGYKPISWWGILAPTGTPAPIVNRLNNEIKTILATDEVKKLFLNDGLDVDYLGLEEFRQFVEGEMANWARVVKKANITLEEQK